MTKECFENQVVRLIERFGAKSFDGEFNKLVSKEMATTPNDEFIRIVDIMIGTRAANRPPLLTDFREMRLQSEKDRFAKETRWAAQELERVKINLSDILQKAGYGKVASITEAIEIEKLKIRTRQADDKEPA